jgi:hypothetical protein
MATPPLVMDGASDEVLARASLPPEGDAGVHGRYECHRSPYVVKGGVLVDDGFSMMRHVAPILTTERCLG